MKPQPKYYITKKVFGMIIQIPVTASEIENLHNQLIADSKAPSEDPLQISIFDTPEEVHR
jgi:hypothetical protein